VRVIHIAGDSCHLTFSYFLPYYDLDLVVASVLPSFHGGLGRGVVAFVLVGVCLGEVSDRLAGCAGAAEAGGRDDAVAAADIGELVASYVRVASAVAVRGEETEDTDWLDFYLPLGALGAADPRVGGYPFGDEGGDDSSAWRAPIDAWFAELGGQVFAAVPFQLALIGFEMSGATDAATLAGHAPEDRPQTGYLIPQGNGLGIFLATN